MSEKRDNTINKLKLPLSNEHKIVRWANSMRGFYGHPIYLVGSQITGKDNPRDVDVICAIPDNEFQLRYGDVNAWMDQGLTGIWTEIRWRWPDDCVKRSLDGMEATGLIIDFKVQPMAQYKGYAHIHAQFPPYQLDTRNNKAIIDSWNADIYINTPLSTQIRDGY